MLGRTILTRLTASALFAFHPGSACSEESAAGVLSGASDVMGADNLKTLRYTADGIGYTFGQAFKPGGAWPKINVHSTILSVNYQTASTREEITISRAEPLGGGGYPPVAQQRNDEFLSGNYAWNQGAAGPLPGPRFEDERTHQLWTTPHGVLLAAIRNNATLQWQDSKNKALPVVSLG